MSCRPWIRNCICLFQSWYPWLLASLTSYRACIRVQPVMFLQCNKIKVVDYHSLKCQLFKERQQPTKVRFLLSWFKNLFLWLFLFSHTWVLNNASSGSTPTLFLIYLPLGLSGFLIYVSFISKHACGSCTLSAHFIPSPLSLPKATFFCSIFVSTCRTRAWKSSKI